MAGEIFSFSISLKDFDPGLLPGHARQLGTLSFSEEVNKFLLKQFKDFPGTARVMVDATKAEVHWTPSAGNPEPLDVIIRKLERGQLAEAIILLELLKSRDPGALPILYNLGMAYSEAGRLDLAESNLRRAV